VKRSAAGRTDVGRRAAKPCQTITLTLINERQVPCSAGRRWISTAEETAAGDLEGF